MQGQFIWYELMTTDTAAAAKFYGEVVGWQARDAGMPGMDYTIVGPPGVTMGVAGVMPLTEEVAARGVPSNWTGYIAAHDVDAMADAFRAEGGAIHRPAEDIPGIGRFAVAADPQGAAICLFSPDTSDGSMPDGPAPGSAGTFGWNELHARDAGAAFDFYARHFGWQKDMAVDMGPDYGVYQTFALDGRAIGGMMNKRPEMPVSCWSFYILVPSIRAAAAKVVEHGGQVLMEPHQVPGGSWICPALDPQGAAFSLMSGSE
jgi:predicted enzyme related to lactoylglutathione lyase